MAVSKVNETSKLVLKVETGTAADGSPIYAQRTFAKINPAIGNDDLHAIGKSLGNLQAHNVGIISRQDNTELIQA